MVMRFYGFEVVEFYGLSYQNRKTAEPQDTITAIILFPFCSMPPNTWLRFADVRHKFPQNYVFR